MNMHKVDLFNYGYQFFLNKLFKFRKETNKEFIHTRMNKI